MTEMAPESAPVTSDPAVSPNPFGDAPVADPAPAPAEATPAPDAAPETPEAPSPAADVEGSAEEPSAAAEGMVRVQLADDGEGQSIVLGNYFVGLSPVEIPADMLDQFEATAIAQGRKIVVGS